MRKNAYILLAALGLASCNYLEIEPVGKVIPHKTAEYRALLDAEVRVLAAAPGERFSIIEICTDRLFLGDAFSRCAAGYCSPREYRRLFRAG